MRTDLRERLSGNDVIQDQRHLLRVSKLGFKSNSCTRMQTLQAEYSPVSPTPNPQPPIPKPRNPNPWVQDYEALR